MLSNSGNKSAQTANGRRKAVQKQKVSEASVLRACCDLLTAERIWWRRWNTGAVKAGKRFFRFGQKGDADIQFTCREPYSSFVHLVWCECKSDTGKQTESQLDFQREVEREGHTYLLVRDVDTLKNWLIEHGVIKP